MKFGHSQSKVLGAGVLSAIAASLCCILPVLALVAGTSSIASIFSWIEPARPYFIGVSVAVLGFAWYQKLKPKPIDECGCAVDEKPTFLQSKTFLVLVTAFTVLMILFPYYSKAFFPKHEKQVEAASHETVQTVEFTVQGMTCTACEEHIKHEVRKLPGIVSTDASYDKSNAIIRFDTTKTNIGEITKAIQSTGYAITHSNIKHP